MNQHSTCKSNVNDRKQQDDKGIQRTTQKIERKNWKLSSN